MPFLRKYGVLTVTGTTAIRIPMIKRGVVDFAVGADWTPASGDVKILVDGTAAANVTNLPTAIAAGNGATWEFVLTAAELSCKQCEVVIADSATKAVEDNSFIVETFGNASAMYQADLSLANLPANVTQLLGTAWLAPGTAGTPDVNAKLIGGTAQTGRDIGASVLLSTGTGTGQLDFTSGVVKANLVQILATALTETSGQIAAAFKKFFNIATPAATMDHGVLVDTVTTTTTATNLTNAPTAGDLTAAMKTSVTTAATAATPVAASVTARVTANADQLAGQTVTAAAGVTFPTSVASPTNITAGTITTVTNLTNAPTAGDLTATMKTSVTTAATAATPAAASVTGAVGSVTGNVGGNVVGSVASVTAAVAITSTIKKNQALAKFQFLMTDSTTHNPVTGKTVTCTRAIDSGTQAAGTLANVTEGANGTYLVDFGAADLNGNVILLRAAASGCDDTFERIITQP